MKTVNDYFKKSIIDDLSIEEYLYGFVNFCLTFNIEMNNKVLDDLLDNYTKQKLELDKIV